MWILDGYFWYLLGVNTYSSLKSVSSEENTEYRIIIISNTPWIFITHTVAYSHIQMHIRTPLYHIASVFINSVCVLCWLSYKVFKDLLKLADVRLQAPVFLRVWIMLLISFFFLYVFWQFFITIIYFFKSTFSWQRKKSGWVCQPLPFYLSGCLCLMFVWLPFPYEARHMSVV